MHEHKKKTIRSQIGISATVERTTEKSEDITKENRKLNEMGEKLNPMPKNMRYLGSAAFHIYHNDTLNQVMFVNQAGPTLNDVNEVICQYAVKDFVGTIMENYGKRRQKFRSGF